MNNSFKEGVDKFWKRFIKEESAIREMIDNKTEGKIIVDKINIPNKPIRICVTNNIIL